MFQFAHSDVNSRVYILFLLLLEVGFIPGFLGVSEGEIT